MGNRSRPNAFQGNYKKKIYFEGWYNKIVDESADNIFAIIPTIALNKKQLTSHSAIQFFDSVNGKTIYFKFPLSEFQNLSNEKYEITIGRNYFSLERMNLDIDQQGYKITGDLRYSNQVLWPRTFLQPGAMGWLTYIPFLETYHGIVSMSHKINGGISINGELVDFEDGKGYIEKDWGRSFPVAWIWTQSNHFTNQNLSFMFSIAKIPFLGKKFNGFLSAISYKGLFFKFATYTGARIESLEILPDYIQIIIGDKQYYLFIKIIKKGIKATSLIAPREGVMSARIAESINSKIKLKLYDLKKKRIVINDTGLNAGFEAKNPEQLKPKN